MKIFSKIIPSSLITRMVLTFVVAIVVTTIVAGLPAYWIIRTALEDQAWQQVVNAERVTRALLDSENIRLENLSRLTSQRPTLQRILATGELALLDDYLQDYWEAADLDILVIHSVTGGVIGAIDPDGIWVDIPLDPNNGYAVSTDGTSLALLSNSPILDPSSLNVIGYVTVGTIVNDSFAEEISESSGYDHLFYLGDREVGASLPQSLNEASLTEIDPDKSNQIGVEITRNEHPYYAAIIPLLNESGEIIANGSVFLSIDDVISAERRALLALTASTILIAAIGSVLGVVAARSLVTPIRELTIAAKKISHGDFRTPVPVTSDLEEVATLAQAFEESRLNTYQALDELSKTNEWLQTIIQSIMEGIVTIDNQGIITSFSKGAERITGLKQSSAVGKDVNRVFSLTSKDSGSQYFELMPQPGKEHQIDVEIRGGKVKTLDVTGAEVMSIDRQNIETALVIRDITEEKAVQNLRTYFLANISHEFRTPLSAINASVELLLEEIVQLTSEEIIELLRSIHLGVTGLQTLIDNLLESASIEAGRFRIRRRQVVTGEIISEALQMMQPLLDRRNQPVVLEDSGVNPKIFVDPTRMTQVLVNLLSNASKYSPMGEEIVVRVYYSNGAHLRFEVADRGKGISLSDQSSLFERFIRLDDQEEVQYGVGLGLSVVKTIVQEHGGEVGVESNPGGGTIMWFTIPIIGDQG